MIISEFYVRKFDCYMKGISLPNFRTGVYYFFFDFSSRINVRSVAAVLSFLTVIQTLEQCSSHE